MYTLDQVLKPEFPRSWHEAVALVQEVADALGPITTVPAPEDLVVEEDGTVVLGFASETAGDPVTGLGSLLMQLLEGVETPPALHSLAADNAKTPPSQSTVAGFSRALAFYERPDRRSDLRALAGRLASKHAAVNSEQEVQRLRERIASAEPEPPPTKQRALPRMTSRQVAMAAIIVISLMGTIAGVRLMGGSSLMAVRLASGAAALAGVAGSLAAPGVAAEREVGPLPAAKSSVPGTRNPPRSASKDRVAGKALPVPLKQPQQRSVALAASRPPMAEAPIAKTIPSRWPPVASAPSRVADAPAAVATNDSVVPLPGHVRAPLSTGTKGTNGPRASTDARGDSILARTDEPGRVYTAAEPEVTPARLLRSQLPREPAPGADTGYFELLVDEAGNVELVKLISPAHRYEDRILVAAAKAWKFKPATLRGVPVKYRLRVSIILPDPAR